MKPVVFPTILLLGVLPPLLAQQPSRPVNLKNEVDELLTTDLIAAASKRVEDVASAPVNVVVLRSQELRALGYRTLGDALGGILGFRSNEDHAYQGLGAAGTYSLGDQNTRTLVLLDGHALNSPAELGSSKVGEDFGYPLELVDRIEVVRGPASTLYGNNAFQSLVNVVTQAAAGSLKSPFQAATTLGSGGRSDLWMQGYGQLFGAQTALMASGFQRTGTALAFPQLSSAPLPAASDREERQSAYLTVTGQDWGFTGSALSRTQRLAASPLGAGVGDPDNRYRNRRLSGEFKWEPRSDAIRWMFRLFGDRNEYTSVLSANPLTSQARATETDPDRSLGLEAQGRALLGSQVTLTFGTEQQLHRYDAGSESAGTPFVTTHLAYRVGNSYLEGAWRLSDRFTAVAGLQWAEWRPTEIAVGIKGQAFDLPRQNIGRLTPRFSFIWKPGAEQVFKAILGQGFRFPTLYERYYGNLNTEFPNPSLRPEIMDSEQLFWSRKLTSQWRTQVTASFFQTRQAIAAVAAALPSESGGSGAGPAVPDAGASAGAPPSGGGGSTATSTQYANADGVRHGRTLEWENAYHSGNLDLSAALGYYHWTYQGEPLPDSSRWSAILKGSQVFGPWSLGGEARYQGSRKAASATDATRVTAVPCNWTLRASLRRETAWGWLQTSVEDLTNSRRQDLVSTKYSPITWMAADGRAVNLTLGVRF